jgi:hypothetical protein
MTKLGILKRFKITLILAIKEVKTFKLINQINFMKANQLIK